MENIIKGGIFGLCIGDVLGVPVEFISRDKLKLNPVVDLREFGTHNQPVGFWSDDTSLTLCLAETLLENNPSTDNLMRRFSHYLIYGYCTPGGNCFDVGNSTLKAIHMYQNGINADFCGCGEEKDNGNGSLMRILPLSFEFIYDKKNFFNDKSKRFEFVKKISSITHSHIRSIISCFYYTEFIYNLFIFKRKNIDFNEIKNKTYLSTNSSVKDFLIEQKINNEEILKLDRIFSNNIQNIKEKDIKSTGYVIDTLEAAIWCLLNTSSYEEAVLKSVNLGDDTDTVGAICGGLAGILYGFDQIPNRWLEKIVKKEEIILICNDLINKYK